LLTACLAAFGRAIAEVGAIIIVGGNIRGYTRTMTTTKAAQWRVPLERMKARKPHTVPLSPQVLELLKSLPREEDNPFVFISGKTSGAHVSGPSLTEALHRAGCTATVHGMRSTFSDWAHEHTDFAGIIIEMSLAHKVDNSVANAYRRTDLAAKRAKLMQAWGVFCCPTADAGRVLPMRMASTR
jgi:integrase